MKKYLHIMKLTVGEYMVYRLNFILWRVRMVMQLLILYFLWYSIYSQNQIFSGYAQNLMLTYVVLTSIVRTLVLGTTTIEIGSLINRGDLSNFLVKPMHFFQFYLAKDIADKMLNFFFAFIEISLFLIVFQPNIFIQTNLPLLFLSTAALVLGVFIYFAFSLLLSFLGFWTPDIWAPRFISFVVIEFFAGALFPLDILPSILFRISQLLPFTYFIFFPIKVYIGDMPYDAIIQGLLTGFFWFITLWLIAHQVWKKGLRIYTAEGK